MANTWEARKLAWMDTTNIKMIITVTTTDNNNNNNNSNNNDENNKNISYNN
jgi:hypothetical protein